MKTISLTTVINGNITYNNSTKNFRMLRPTNKYLINNEAIIAIAYSYSTIIAVRTNSKLYVTDEKYSVTTSKHCSLAIRELATPAIPVIRCPLEIFPD